MPNAETNGMVFHEVLQRSFRCRRGIDGYPSGLQCDPHLHNDLELVYLESGHLTAYADTAKVELNSGDIFLAFPNQIHYYRSPDRKESYLLFIVKPENLPEYAELLSLCLPSSPLIRGADQLPRVKRLLRMLWESEQDTVSSCLQPSARRNGYLLALFSELFLHVDMQASDGEDSGSAREIIRYCSEHFSENLSLAALEEALHLNKYYISHLFSSKLGISFNNYINSLRVSEACRLLRTTEKSITEICESIGFNTLRTFNRAFTKQIGIPPSQYRKAGPSVIQTVRLPGSLPSSPSLQPLDRIDP